VLPAIHIQPDEYRTRAGRLAAHLAEQELAGAVLFDPYYILYFTGFAFIPTERPMAYVLNAAGEAGLFVPRLEREHARQQSGLARVVDYVEYPYHPHPMNVLKGLLDDLGVRGRVGADHDGYPWVLGYRGPALSELTGDTIVRVGAFVEDLMMIKSDAEIALIRESVKWGHLAHRLLQRYTAPGASEIAVSLRASQEATLILLDTLGPLYRAQSAFWHGAQAGYRGQIGRNAAIPHALANNLTFQPGDVLVTGAGAPVWGYHSELERTMVVGQPTARQRELFEHMLAAQTLAIEALRPGTTCADVDRAVRKYYEDNDLMDYWKHHSGHAIGLRYHEGPFLDVGDHTELRAGMVFTVEPGLYVPDLGGFRHSDTVLVTAGGHEVLTYYPRDLESLII
jgi:Xaa-Pro aminopeptidase